MPVSGPDPASGRRAARLVLLDEGNAVLLLSGRDPGLEGAPLFWFLPGGGVDAGETLEDAARREVYEETGARLGDLGPVVWERDVSFPFDGKQFEQHEFFFVVRTVRFPVSPTALTDLELRMTTGARWWPLDELATPKEPVYPSNLASLISSWLVEGPPVAPRLIE